jgi:hypothetical protein
MIVAAGWVAEGLRKIEVGIENGEDASRIETGGRGT